MSSSSVLQKVVDQLIADVQGVTLSVGGEAIALRCGQGVGNWPGTGAGVDVELTVGPAYSNQDCSGRIDYTHDVNFRFRALSADVSTLAMETIRTHWYTTAARVTLSALQVLSFLPVDADPPLPFRQQGTSQAQLCDQRFMLRIEYQY